MSDQKETISNSEDTKATVTKRPWVTPKLYELSSEYAESGTKADTYEVSADPPSYFPTS